MASRDPRPDFHDQPSDDAARDGITRREFVISTGVITATMAFGASAVRAAAGAPSSDFTTNVEMTINGRRHKFALDPRVTLLDLLREDLALTGTKKGCDHGQCGACTVLVNGRRINSCLSLAASHHGDSIVTVEGLARGDELDPVQAAFIEHDGFQCGYCTPGQICSAVAMLAEVQRGDASAVTVDLAKTGAVEISDAEIRERMSGNICRCGAYPGIVAAIRQCAVQKA
ncbi:MAG TPA: 2Fe-2S iron-sulfur cluster-binding protein [Candidatus Binataceae bacterium]|nr:2Fe-2S iron-sulfur cluster-binding protein [Candidatus Binataceae bacterium]